MALADLNTDTAMAEPKEEGDTEQETALVVAASPKPKSLMCTTTGCSLGGHVLK